MPNTVLFPSYRAAHPLPSALASRSLSHPRFGADSKTDVKQENKTLPKLPVAKKRSFLSEKIYQTSLKVLTFFYTRPSTVMSAVPRWMAMDMNPTLLPKDVKLEPVAMESLDGTKLKGYWMAAPKPSKKTLILGHGYYTDYRMMLPLALEMRKENLNIFLFDFRAHGASDGKVTSVGYNESKDIAAAVLHVKKHFGDKAEKLGYMGHSMGAASMMMLPKSIEKYPEALEQVHQSLDCIVLDSPFAYLKPSTNPFVTMLCDVKSETFGLKQLCKMIQPGLASIVKGLANGFEENAEKLMELPVKLSDIQTAEMLKSHPLSQKPILLMHGVKDQWTHFEHSQGIYDALKDTHPNLQFQPLEESNHYSKEVMIKGKKRKLRNVVRAEGEYLPKLNGFLKQLDTTPQR